MNQLYAVPIIPSNLQREETVIQIADVLHYLFEITDNILTRVNNRIEINNRHIKNISERISVASEKVAFLSGAKKATRVFSSSKYPATDVNRNYASIFNKSDSFDITRHKAKSKTVPPLNDETLDTLQFYHVKIRNSTKKEPKIGLGPLPAADITSVNDLLLYGTGKNPYREYVMSDTLKIKQKLKETEQTDASTDIGVAPLSISDRTALTRSTTETYFYSPDIGDVPAIDVPLDLPDLPGIADDLRYVDELGSSGIGIAPSATTTPNIPAEWPAIIDETKDEEKKYHVDFEVEVRLPSPPPCTVVENVEKVMAATESTERKPEEELAKEFEKPHADEVVQVSAPKLIMNNNEDNARASLMEAIRKVGGSKNAKLRTTAEKKDEQKVPHTGGDLMADLHAKLAMRRKGISGAKNQEANNSDGSISAMDRISAMIPPPPQKTDLNESTNTEDEDWD